MEVLCIEDEKIIAWRVAKLLEKAHADTTVKTVGSLDEARRFLKAHTPDIIITDIFLPDGKATEIILEMSKIPVIAMTGRGNESVAVEIMKTYAVENIP